jgi:hypothetical protein
VETLQDVAQLIAIVVGIGALPFAMDWIERAAAAPRPARRDTVTSPGETTR